MLVKIVAETNEQRNPTALPVIIGFFFTHYGLKDYPILRKIFWIFFTVVFVAMWSENYFVAGPIAWMYFWTALICLLFFLFDGTIRRALIKQQMDQAGVDSNLKFARHIKDELYELHEQKRIGIIDDKEYYKIKKQLSKQLRTLAKY